MIVAMMLGAAQASAPVPQRLLDCTQIHQAVMTSREEDVPKPKRASDVQLVAEESLCNGWTIIDMWRTGFDGPSVVWRARRKVMDLLGRLTVTTTDAAACPTLISVLAKLDDLSVKLSVLPRPWKPGTMPPPIVVDGTEFMIRLLRTNQGAYVTVSSSAGPVADWAEASMKQLEPCWRPVV